MKRLGLDGLIAAVLKKLGVPTSTTITTPTLDDTLVPQAVNDPDDLPPELADYPGVRKLFAEAQQQGAASSSDHVALPPEVPADGQGTERREAQPIHDVSELPASLPGNPEIRKLEEDAKRSAVSFPAGRATAPAEIAKDLHPQKPAKVTERNPGSAVGPRVHLPPGAIDERTVQRLSKANPVGRVSKAFDWILLIALCLGLAFAVAALIVLFRTTHVPP
jgi:hypothetical protein